MPNILWIDRWSKYIWLAKVQEWQTIPMPLGYLDNTSSAIFQLADMVIRESIIKVVIGYPLRQKNTQQKIDKFIKDFQMVIDPTIPFERVDEDYTSVQAGAKIANYKKNVAEDTLSAMIILDRRLQK